MFGKKAKEAEHACCEVPGPAGGTEAAARPADPAHCPASGTIGLTVELVTVKALLSGDALRRLDGHAYRFCPAPDCDVVYFDNAAGSAFRKRDLTVRVGQKESEDPIPVCYCFGFAVADLRRDLDTRGHSDIPAFIAGQIRAGHCACEVKNPQGTCCLGNVSKALRQAQAELATETR